jgi:hypothetical protein
VAEFRPRLGSCLAGSGSRHVMALERPARPASECLLWRSTYSLIILRFAPENPGDIWIWRRIEVSVMPNHKLFLLSKSVSRRPLSRSSQCTWGLS